MLYARYWFLGAFSKLHKFREIFFLSALLSAGNSSVPTGQIYVISDIVVFFENLSIKFKFL